MCPGTSIMDRYHIIVSTELLNIALRLKMSDINLKYQTGFHRENPDILCLGSYAFGQDTIKITTVIWVCVD